MNDKVLDKVSEIVDTIKKSDLYIEYTDLSKKLEKHEKANKLISEIKDNQKKLVKLESLNKDTSLLESEINKKKKELNMIPLYVRFVRIQEELNDTYQLIKERLDNYFEKIVN